MEAAEIERPVDLMKPAASEPAGVESGIDDPEVGLRRAPHPERRLVLVDDLLVVVDEHHGRRGRIEGSPDAQVLGGDPAVARVPGGEIALHAIEGLEQLAELVRRAGRDDAREVAGGDLVRDLDRAPVIGRRTG
jgi:hypothetical protein